MRKIALLFSICMSIFSSSAKDIIEQKNGTSINCDVVLEDSTNVYFIAKFYNEKKTTFLKKEQIHSIKYDTISHNFDIILLKNKELYCGDIYAIEDTIIHFRNASDGSLSNGNLDKNRIEKVISNLHKEPYKFGVDRFSKSVGLGFVNGGIGVNFCAYPIDAVGIFFGGGLVGVIPSGCMGIKLRPISEKYKYNYVPYCIGMYGINTIDFDDELRNMEVWYGFTVGLGLEIRSDLRNTNYFSLACLYPFRDPKAGLTYKFSSTGTTFHVDVIEPKFSPITINLAYHF